MVFLAAPRHQTVRGTGGAALAIRGHPRAAPRAPAGHGQEAGAGGRAHHREPWS